MDEEARKKLDLLSQTLSKLQNMDQEIQTLAKHLAELRMELMNAGENALSEKVGDVFSAASRNRELVKAIEDDLEIEVNQLRTE